MNPRQTTFRRIAAIAAVAAFTLAACGSDTAESEPADTTPVETEAPAAVEMSIADPWSRQPAEGQTATAVYGIVSNPGDTDVTIVAASSPESDQVELHETLVGDDGAMSMQEREEGFVVPAGGEFVFEPGGPHVMMLGIDAATYPAEVEVTLEFDGADPLTFTAEVRAIDGGMSMGEMDHDDMGDDAMGDDMAEGEMAEGDMADGDEGHDHGDEMADHGDELDVSALHEVDEQLANGTLDAMAQRMVVGDYIELFEAKSPEAGTPEAEVLDLLVQLDAALEAGDLAAAAPLAAAAHEAAHDLGHGHG